MGTLRFNLHRIRFLRVGHFVVDEATTPLATFTRAANHVGVCALWPIMFLQFQCAGVRLLFAQGVRVALRG